VIAPDPPVVVIPVIPPFVLPQFSSDIVMLVVIKAILEALPTT